MSRSMTSTPKSAAPKSLSKATSPGKVGFVSLGCPKALVDSERILTSLRAEGYDLAPSYEGADVVVVNTCGFLDSAKAESLEAIGEALHENGKVVVTGCMGADEATIRAVHPNVLSVSGPQQYEQVVGAVHDVIPPLHDPKVDLIPPQGIKLTPRHYAYLKISEGCNHGCKFCIIPSMRGKLDSRPAAKILYEAERLVKAGVKELLVISQDTSAYGLDLRYSESRWNGREIRAHIQDLARELGSLGAWVRLHYVYPYPHVDHLIDLMADGTILPYLDIPFQHASPNVLANMRRPAHQERTLERIKTWRSICPNIAIRSTFITGFPGETEEDFESLLDWLEEAQLDRVGCFAYENVDGAAANDLPDHVPDAVKEDRRRRFMEAQSRISAAKLVAKRGQTLDALVDTALGEDGYVTARSYADAPEIDGEVLIEGPGTETLQPGDTVSVLITDSDEHDLYAEIPSV